MTEEITNKYIKISESDDESNEPLIQTQDMSTDEWLDQMNDNNMPKVIVNSKVLSQQEILNTSDEWKGKPVVNYKTFRKFSQTDRDSNQMNCSPKPTELVRLKKYDNPYYKHTNNNSQNSRKH
jgi:hypothetical protein